MKDKIIAEMADIIYPFLLQVAYSYRVKIDYDREKRHADLIANNLIKQGIRSAEGFEIDPEEWEVTPGYKVEIVPKKWGEDEDR